MAWQLIKKTYASNLSNPDECYIYSFYTSLFSYVMILKRSRASTMNKAFHSFTLLTQGSALVTRGLWTQLLGLMFVQVSYTISIESSQHNEKNRDKHINNIFPCLPRKKKLLAKHLKNPNLLRTSTTSLQREAFFTDKPHLKASIFISINLIPSLTPLQIYNPTTAENTTTITNSSSSSKHHLL